MLNPFDGLVETLHFPHARMFRTSLWQKVKDTFWLISGDVRLNKLGLLDYVTLFIAKIFLVLGHKSLQALFDNELPRKNFNNWFYGFSIPLWLITFPLLTAHYALAGTLTVICLPILFLIQGICYLISGKELESALAIEDQKNQTLLAFLHNERAHLEELKFEEVKSNDSSYECIFSLISKPNHSFTCSPSNEQSQNFSALFKHNIGNIVGVLEKCSKDSCAQIFLEKFI